MMPISQMQKTEAQRGACLGCPNWQVAEPGINLDRSGPVPRLPLPGMQSCEGKGLEIEEAGWGHRKRVGSQARGEEALGIVRPLPGSLTGRPALSILRIRQS